MWGIPDKGAVADNVQSILFSIYLDVLAAGIDGIDCTLFGGVCTSNANMTVAVSQVAVMANNVQRLVAGANATIGAADATNPRFDLIVITSAGAIAVRAGTAAAAPKPPNRTANDVVLAAVFVPATDTNIATNQIVDLRVTRDNSLVRNVRKTADAAFSTITMNDVTGMDFLLEGGGTYAFEYFVYFTTNINTVGIKLSVNITGTPTNIKIANEIAGAISANSVAMGSGVAVVKDALGATMTTGPGVSNSVAMVHGTVTVPAGAADTLKLRHGSETASATTILAGSWGRLTRIN